ncbi:hypothetical cytosolic protein [Syntrophus aciditrophicus SB]|uniref:Hypothetical cytosolic protein n=1 Tax=Syntrophus aciditrophicus (strain SB) TaxID=56780 RepID=Q2LVX5_SYNAS|nr:hypothetical cytosolic protein [Syntrophus aciditrophicus SB]
MHEFLSAECRGGRVPHLITFFNNVHNQELITGSCSRLMGDRPEFLFGVSTG